MRSGYLRTVWVAQSASGGFVWFMPRVARARRVLLSGGQAPWSKSSTYERTNKPLVCVPLRQREEWQRRLTLTLLGVGGAWVLGSGIGYFGCLLLTKPLIRFGICLGLLLWSIGPLGVTLG